MVYSLLPLSLLVTSAIAGPLGKRDSVTAIVDLGTSKGTPRHVASGFIYGIPDKENQVPDHWYTDIDFQYGRAGGAQLDAPDRGWIWGPTEYNGRLESTLSNYRTSRKYGASFIILPHDIWGTDHVNSSTVWPGDNGNWADYDTFVKKLLDDLAANDALEGLVYDVWNEPDISIFWERSLQQWVDLYIRTHKIIRADSRFNNVKISGPSLAFRPMTSNAWWTTWLSQIAGNNTAPDQYSYHLEGTLSESDNDPQYTNTSLSNLQKQYGLPSREVNINEYAEYSEMMPSGYAWWISRLERYDFWGLLGNWQGGTVLHDLFANLLTKVSNPYDYTATDYAAAPGYWVYRYYAQNMTGSRVATAGSSDTWFDVYATVGDRVRILSGSKVTIGTWAIQVNNLEAIGLPSSGSVSIDTWGFIGDDPFDPFKVTGPPTFRNTVSHTYSGNTLTFPIYQTDNHTAWAFEFDVN